MRRLFAILMIALIPLQTSAALAGAACAHDSSATAHVTAGMTNGIDCGSDASDAESATTEEHCAACHLSLSKFLVAASEFVSSAPSLPPLSAPLQADTTADPRTPERVPLYLPLAI